MKGHTTMSTRKCAACGAELVQRSGWKIVDGLKSRLETNQHFSKRRCCDDKCQSFFQLQSWGNQVPDKPVIPQPPAWASKPGPRNYAVLWR